MKKIFRWLYGGLFGLTGLLFMILSSLPDGHLHVFILDIGQGDALLIRTPADEYVLIDGGPDSKILGQLGLVMPFYERSIDVVILSHPHADHVNGLVEVLKRYHVRQIIMSGVPSLTPGYQAFLEQISQQKIPVVFAGSASSQIKMNSVDYRLGSVILDILYPFSSLQGQSFENFNNSSIAFRLLFGKKSFYFSGDLEIEGEEKLVRSGLELGANFFKAGHHGSRTSSTEPLLNRIKPEYAVISCGIDNQFHHPHPLTLQHFQKRNFTIFRTDLDGIIEAKSDGENLMVWPWGKQRLS